MGEFSPNAPLFTLNSFMEIAEVAYIFGLLFAEVKVMHHF
jgi:hypothetical protein